MKTFNVSCISCSNQLAECGLLLETHIGPLICCNVCRKLYYVDVITNADGNPLILMQPTDFVDEDEFEIIRSAISSVPLSEYLSEGESGELKDSRIVNPHFDKDLKTVIEESVTPSDIIRGLNGTK
jgi:hypothetical protein